MTKLKNLLKELDQLHEHHQAQNQREAVGFNIFSLLLKAGDEVNLHSKFIYELLDSKGSHHQGTLFLNLFLEEIGIKNADGNLSIFKEKYHIDILLQSSSKAILIENKIYTKDHSSQLSRYVKKIRSEGYKKSNITLIYLTLFGHTPTEKKMQKSVICLSYRKNIVHWLERCLEGVVSIPILHETVKQYLNLVKELTHQSVEKGFILDVKNFLLKENNLQRVIELESSIVEAKIEVQLYFWHTLLSHLIPHYAFSFYNMNRNKGLKNSVRRYYQQQKNIKDYGIKYQVDENLYFFIELRNNIYYGFEFVDESLIEQKQKDVLDTVNIEWNEISSTVYWKYPFKRLDFKSFNHQNIFDLIDEDLKEEEIRNISNEIINLIADYQRKI